MPNPELKNYLEQALAAGQTAEEVKASLLAAGWPEDLVVEAVSELSGKTQLSGEKSTSTSSRQTRRIWPYLVTLLIILIFGCAIYITKLWEIIDIAPPDVSHLASTAVPLSPDDNAFDLVEQLGRLDLSASGLAEANRILNELLAGQTLSLDDEDLISSWEGVIASSSVLIRAAAARTGYQYPSGIDGDGVSTSLYNLRVLSFGIISYHIRQQLVGVEGVNWPDDLTAILSLGINMAVAPISVDKSAVAHEMINRSLAGLRQLVLISDINDAELKLLQEELEGLFSGRELYVESIKRQYRQALQIITTAHEQRDYGYLITSLLGYPLTGIDLNGLTSYHLRPHRTQALFADLSALILEDMRTPCHLSVPEYYYYHLIQLILYPGQARVEVNGVGKSVFELFRGSAMIIKPCQNLSQLALTTATIDLKRHFNATGSWPDTLSDLVPDFVETIPLDPFTNALFMYDKERGLLYSVGANRVDNTVPKEGDGFSYNDDIVLDFGAISKSSVQSSE